MALTLKIGAVDLSTYARLNPDDGFDPYDASGYLDPQWLDSPIAEGQLLTNVNVSNREMAWPLFLKAADKQTLHDLVVTINKAINDAAGYPRVEWADAGATNSTYYDTGFARFDPDYSFRRAGKNIVAGVLRIWSRPPYGHTGTERIVGTAAGTGPILRVPIASLGGDVGPLPVYSMAAGNAAPWMGDRVLGVAALPHASYAVDIPAASFVLGGGAALVGASGAHGSQAVTFGSQAFDSPGRYIIAPLPIPSVYAGRRHRVLALARSDSNLHDAVALYAANPQGGRIGATALATAPKADWQLVDLGVWSVPSYVGASFGLKLIPGKRKVYNAQAINRVYILPEDTTALWVDGQSALSANEDATTGTDNAALVGQTDLLGQTWASVAFTDYNLGASGYLARSVSSAMLFPQTNSGVFVGLYAGAQVGASAVNWRAVMRVVPDFSGLGAGAYNAASSAYVLRKSGASAIGARLSMASAGPFFTLEAGRDQVLACQALVATALKHPLDVMVDFRDGQVIAQLHACSPSSAMADVTLTASSAFAGMAGRTEVGVYLASWVPTIIAGPCIRSLSVETIAGTYGQAGDLYDFNAITGDRRRLTSASVVVAQLAIGQRGQLPMMTPSTPAVAFLQHPLHGGDANDIMSAVVRTRERFTFAR